MALTKAQEKFISSKDKFIRLLAPAGCGKTFSIMEKTKEIRKNKKKVKINIFTFTKNATQEIIDRCGGENFLSVNTLNSWGNNYVKNSVLKNAKLISSSEDRRFCVLHNLQPVWGKSKHKVFEELFTGRLKIRNSEKFLNFIDYFKDLGFKHTDFTNDDEHNKKIYLKHLNFIKKVGLLRYYNSLIDELINSMPIIFRKIDLDIEEDKNLFVLKKWIPFWKDCCNQMFENGIYTLDDQKYFANLELEKRLNKKEYWTGATKCDYIFVDEFQDINPLDLMLISNLQKINDASLIIVGDDDQAIFEFRGATPYFILHPDEVFERKFITFCLDKNFRSPANIVQKSQTLISHNQNRVEKFVTSGANNPLAEIKYINADSQTLVNQVISVIKNILQKTKENVVIVSRLKASLLPYQVLLTKDNIEYSVSDDLAFFYTNAAQNLNKVLDIKKSDKKIGPKEFLELICVYSKNEIYKKYRNILWHELMSNDASVENIYNILWQLGIKEQGFKKLLTEDFIHKFIQSVNNFRDAKNVYDTIKCLLSEFEGLKKNYSRSLEDLYYKDPPLSSLLDFAQQYNDDFDGFCNDFNNAIEKILYTKDLSDVTKTRVVLSTALRIKGQEFDNVIILNANDGVWPKLLEESAIESERRLFYVAVTRAKHKLFFAVDDAPASPFITEGEFDK